MTDPLDKSNPTQAEYFKDIVGTIREPLLVLDANLRVLAANRNFYKFFKVKAGETIGRLIYDLGDRQWDIPGLRLLLETILPQKAVFNDYNVEHDFPVIGRRILLLNARRARGLPDKSQWILLAFEDVTERRRLERSLEDSEKRFRRAFETAHDGMLLVEKTGGQVVNSNQSVEDMLGYSKRTLQKKNLWELGILKDEGQFQQTALELEAQGIVGLPEMTIPTKRGGNFPADVFLTDRAAVIQCNIRDTTDRTRIIGALKDNEKKYFDLVDQSPEGIFLIESSGRITTINEAMCKELAFSREELLSMSIWDIIPEQFLIHYRNRLIKILAGENLASAAEYALRGKDGKNHYVEILSAPHYSGKEIVGFRGIARDITERKKAEQALAESAIKFKWLYEYAPVAYHILSPEGIITDVNRKWCAFSGYRREEAIGKAIFDFVDEQERQAAKDSYEKKKLTKQSFIEGSERNFRTKAGAVKTVKTYDFFVLDEAQNVTSVQTTIEDITERKQAEEQLKEYSGHLEEMVEHRTRELRQAQEELVRKEKLAVLGQLAGGVGHELRNPLGVISNSVYYLKLVQPDANEKIRKHHAMIEQEVHNAARIVSDLLDYAREITTDPQPGSVPELLEHALSRFPAPDSIQVSFKIPASLPQVYADPLQVEQVLGNLITNACQSMANPSLDTKARLATTSGRCKLTISVHLRKQMVAIAVKDTGTGVTPENMQKLFEPLFTTKAKGIGLGLAVSKKLAEANAGRIEVESQVGKGSTFTLYLPVMSAELEG